MTTNAPKTINYGHIAVPMAEFNALHKNGMDSLDPIAVESVARKMMLLQTQIEDKMARASTSISNYFNWTSAADRPVEANEINSGIQFKLQQILDHSAQVSSISLTGRTTSVTPPTTPSATGTTVASSTATTATATTSTTTTTASSSTTTAQPTVEARDLATGFCNKSANCWLNSLLSSFIVNIPSFRQAYETVANHYARNGATEIDRRHGASLQNALDVYDISLALRQPIDKQVTQDVRLAFNHFFGRVDVFTGNELFSSNEHAHEDAHEALQMIMTRQQEILLTQNQPLPSLYCPLETKRHYRPIGEPSLANPGDEDRYSRVGGDNASAVTAPDYQVILEIQNQGHLSFADQLANCFRSPAVVGSEPATHVRPDGQRQQFELIATSNQFTQIPDEFVLPIKRFGRNPDGTGFKITTPVQINRTIVLPNEATRENIPIAYELDAFIVHTGGFGSGHYIGYKKLQGRWIETDDGVVRFANDQSIDRILHGLVNIRGVHNPNFTSYCHHYSRMPQSQQAETIAASTNTTLPQRPAVHTLFIEKYTKEKQAFETVLQGLDAYAQGVRSGADDTVLRGTLNALESPILDTLCHAIWLNDKTPNVFDYGTATLNANPKKLQEIQLPWLIASNGGLDTQMSTIAKMKLAVVSENLKTAQALGFWMKLNGPFTSNEELLIAFRALPDQLRWALHGLVYEAHKIRLGDAAVSGPDYGRKAIENENGDIRKVLTEAKESVLNIFGRNIVEQLANECKNQANKIQIRYEMLQLQAFHALLTQTTVDISAAQLNAAFERLDIRKELKEKLHLLIWYADNRPDIHLYGANTFKANPRCVLNIREAMLAGPPICEAKSDILTQMISLLDRDSR